MAQSPVETRDVSYSKASRKSLALIRLLTDVATARLRQPGLETDHNLHLQLSLRMNAAISSTSQMPSWRLGGDTFAFAES